MNKYLCFTQYRNLAWCLLIVNQQVSFGGPNSQQWAGLGPQDQGHLISGNTDKHRKQTQMITGIITATASKSLSGNVTHYFMPLSIWVVLLTLASQRYMELDFAAITAKMSPSLSQSIPTQRLEEGKGKRVQHRAFWMRENQSQVLTLTLGGWVQPSFVHADHIFSPSCPVCVSGVTIQIYNKAQM